MSKERTMPEPILTIYNNHIATCGTPPVLNNRSAPNLYLGYFENKHIPTNFPLTSPLTTPISISDTLRISMVSNGSSRMTG